MDKQLLFKYRFRRAPYRYNDTMPWLAGSTGLVLAANGTKVQAIWTDVPDLRVQTMELTQFVKEFHPDFTSYDHVSNLAYMKSARHLVPMPLNVLSRLDELLAKARKIHSGGPPRTGRAYASPHTYRTALVLTQTETEVTYATLTDRGFQVKTRPRDKFNDWYFLTLFDSVAATELYLSYLGYYASAGSDDLRLRLEQLIDDLSTEDKIMAKTQRKVTADDDLEMLENEEAEEEEDEEEEEIEEVEARPARKAAAASAPKAGTVKAKAKPAAAKAAPAKGEKKAAAVNGRPIKLNTETAAGMFMTLIMEGKFKDDAIFAKVQKKFDLPDSRRSYVKWYRNHLDKRGMNPPPPVG